MRHSLVRADSEGKDFETNNLGLSQFEKARKVHAVGGAYLRLQRRAGFAHQEQVEVRPEERRDDAEREGPRLQLRNRRLLLVKRQDLAACAASLSISCFVSDLAFVRLSQCGNRAPRAPTFC